MKKGSIMGLSPIIVFLVVYAGTGLITGGFSNMPLLVAFIIAAAFALLINRQDKKLTIDEKVDIFQKGQGIQL